MLKAITYILENDNGVQSLVGNNAAGDKHKIYPVVVPETETAPYCVCRISSKTITGKNCGYIWTIEVSSYDTTYDDVTLLNDAVINALISEGPGTVNSETFGWANHVNESDDFNKDHDLYVKIATFEVHGL